MRRLLLVFLASFALFAQKPTVEPKPQEPVEEDKTLQPLKEYEFNPLQAESEITTGKYYFKKGSYKAAAGRFREATKWNPQSADAYLWLGNTLSKSKDAKGAKEAYTKYLELAPDAKNAAEIKRKL